MGEIENVDRRKYYAAHILAEVWAGAKLPESMVLEAKKIRTEMLANGTWESA